MEDESLNLGKKLGSVSWQWIDEKVMSNQYIDP